jgi:hypothetical protein
VNHSPDRTPTPKGQEEQKPSAALRSLAADIDRPTELGALLATAGTRVHGLALLILALPDAVPLPVPSASTVLGIPLLFISLHLALFGDQAQLPRRVLAAKLPTPVFVRAVRFLIPTFEWIERHSISRWPTLMREHLVGVLCTYLSVLLLLPIPLVNTPPAMCLACIAVGLIRRDGFLVIIGAMERWV